MLRALLVPALLLLALSADAADAPPVRAIGEAVQQHGVWTVTGKTATLVVGEPDLGRTRLCMAVRLAGAPGAVEMAVLPGDAGNLQQASVLRASLHRDAAGRRLTGRTHRFDAGTQRYAGETGWPVADFTFWPDPNDTLRTRIAAESEVPPQSWRGRWLPLEVQADGQSVSLWVAGRLLQQVPRPAEANGPFAITLAQGDEFTVRSSGTLAPLRRPVDLSLYTDPATGQLDLSRAGWFQVKDDPSDYYELYDGGPVFLGDPRMPMLRVPAADYVAAWVTGAYDGHPQHGNVVTLRVGRYGYAGQVVQHDFSAQMPAGAPRRVCIPMPDAFAQDIVQYFDIEITKEVRLARRQPDPCRFRTRPLGLPSGVTISGLELELSPLQLRVTSEEAGHAFVAPRVPTFAVTLTNITDRAQSFRLTADAVPLNGTKTGAGRTGTVAPHQAVTVQLPLPVRQFGYHDLTVTLADATGRVLLRRTTSFARLPEDTRQYRAQSPFGTWDFYGGHFTPSDPEQLGPLYVKAGLRYGMFGADTATLQKYGVRYGTEPVTLGPEAAKGYAAALAKLPGYPPPALLFHEHGISGRHVTRVPDLFTDRPPYVMDATEQKAFDSLYKLAVEGATAMRAAYPTAHLRLGNGTLPFKEELYRRHFPAALFDSAGNESGSFGRLPETQPPDYIGNNASLWMDRQLLDAYGYQDKPVTQCYEICYPCTNPGNLDERTQADYLVRHALHSLAWGIPEIKVGLITDVGNSYYFSNWGAAGLCRQLPEMAVKPSFVAFATLTRVLDGAKFVRDVPLGSPTLYALEFARRDGKTVYALWTIRGTRVLSVRAGAPGATLTDSQGNARVPRTRGGLLAVPVSPSPVYLVCTGQAEVQQTGVPQYAEKPQGKVAKLAPLADLADWQVEPGRNPELETYDFMHPRRLGRFRFEPVKAFDGRRGAIRVTPQPLDYGTATMPMYVVLAHKTGIRLPGRPTEVGLQVHGNSGWGRLVFELKDASGQRWISLGAQQEGDLSPWLQDWMPKAMLAQYPTPGLGDWNTNDCYGISRINFDGWRYLSFPLPGNYPGERYPWPANSQWRWDKDGVVHYPLTLTKVIIDLPEQVLHVKGFAAPPRAEIYLRALVSCEGALRTNK